MTLAIKSDREVLACLLSASGIYRYLLRVWIGVGPALVVIQKNPSLADAQRADPTVGKVETWARRQGFGLITYLNLFAYCSPDPATINGLTYAAAVGPDNDTTLCQAIQSDATLVLGWGNPNGIEPARYQQRIDEVLTLLRTQSSGAIYQIGPLTQAGHPRHGLHWNGDAQMQMWSGD